MNQQITDKTYAILYWNEDHDWITEKEAEAVKEAMRRGDKCIEIDGEMSMMASIARIIKGEKMEAIIRRKSGQRQCLDCGRWIPPKMQCGCQGGKY